MTKTFSILLLIFFINILEINAQIKPGASINSQTLPDYLLKKSKNQKTAAWILLGSGSAVAIAGSIIGTNAVKNSNPNDPFDIFPPGSLAGGAMILGGIAAIVASVPFFIASGKNKRKANLILQNEPQSFLRQLHKGKNYSVGVSFNF